MSEDLTTMTEDELILAEAEAIRERDRLTLEMSQVDQVKASHSSRHAALSDRVTTVRAERARRNRGRP